MQWGLAEDENTYISIAGLKIINDSIMLFWTFNDESMHSGINVFSMNGELKAEYDIHWPDGDKMAIDNVVIDIEGNSYVLGRSESWKYILAKFSKQGELLDNVKFNESTFPWGMALDSSSKLVTYNNNGVRFLPESLTNLLLIRNLCMLMEYIAEMINILCILMMMAHAYHMTAAVIKRKNCFDGLIW